MPLSVPSLIVPFVVLTWPATPAAQPPPASPVPVLTLGEALARAESASPLVRRAQAERQVVAAREVGASLLLPSNPVLAAGAGPYRDPAGQSIELLAHGEQTVEIGGQRAARRAVVRHATEAAGWREQAARVETRARVRAAYVGAQLAHVQQEAAAAREALMLALLDAVRARVSGGASSDVDLEQARLERGVAVRAQLEARAAEIDALARLRALIGMPAAQPLAVDPQVAAPPPRAERLPVLLERAERQRAELAALRAGGNELDAEITRLRREAIPSPTLFVDFERDRAGQYFVAGGVSIPIPVWRRQQGELALARADRARLEDERALAARDVASEVARAYQLAQADAATVALLDRETLPAADAVVKLLTDGWRAGKFDLFRVLQTTRDASEARRLYLETLGSLWEATIALDRAVGTP